MTQLHHGTSALIELLGISVAMLVVTKMPPSA